MFYSILFDRCPAWVSAPCLPRCGICGGTGLRGAAAAAAFRKPCIGLLHGGSSNREIFRLQLKKLLAALGDEVRPQFMPSSSHQFVPIHPN